MVCQFYYYINIFGNGFNRKQYARHVDKTSRPKWSSTLYKSENKTINVVGHNNSVHDGIYFMMLASLRGLHLRFNFTNVSASPPISLDYKIQYYYIIIYRHRRMPLYLTALIL